MQKYKISPGPAQVRAAQPGRGAGELPSSLSSGLGLGFGVWGLGFGVWGSGFRVQGLGFGVWGSGFGVRGLGFRV